MSEATARTQQRRVASAYLPGLIWTLVRTDFKTRYHGTVGGYLWALLKPLTMFVVLFAIFSLVFEKQPRYSINLIIGIFLWEFFSEATRTGLGCLEAKSFLLTKARCPAWVVVVTSTSNALVTLILFSLVMCAYLAFIAGTLALGEVLLFAFYLFMLLLVVLGISFAASVLYLRYRDLNQFWDLTLQAGFFIAPVIYPLDIIPHKYHFYLYIWLPTAVIQFSRQVLVDGEPPTTTAHLMLLASALVALAVGFLLFDRLAPRAVERL